MKKWYCELCNEFVEGRDECPYHEITTCVDTAFYTLEELTDFILDEVESYGVDVSNLREEWDSIEDNEHKLDIACEIQEDALNMLPDPYIGTFFEGSVVIYKRLKK